MPDGTVFPAPEVVVLLAIDVGATGQVEAVRVDQGAGEPFDSAAVAAARQFTFEPGRLTTGEPVPVTIAFRMRLTPPAPAEAPPPPPPPVRLSGRLLERGTRKPLASVAVAARTTGEPVRTTTGPDGRFALEVPESSFTVVAVAGRPRPARAAHRRQARARSGTRPTTWSGPAAGTRRW